MMVLQHTVAQWEVPTFTLASSLLVFVVAQVTSDYSIRISYRLLY